MGYCGSVIDKRRVAIGARQMYRNHHVTTCKKLSISIKMSIVLKYSDNICRLVIT